VPVSRETFVAYGQWFQETFVREVERTTVTEVRRNSDGYTLELASGETAEAERVVVASGLEAFAFVPPLLRELGPTLASHTFEHRTFAAFAGREVAVIGAGQSALESAVLLREAGAIPRVVARAPVILWNPTPPPARSMRQRLRAPETGLGASWRLKVYLSSMGMFRRLPPAKRIQFVRETLGPAGAWWLRERFAEVDAAVGETVVAAVPDGERARLTLANGQGRRVVDVDHVLAGTGFRIQVDAVPFLPEELRREIRRVDGAPALTATLESSVSGLYFAGLPAAYTLGPAMRFVFGTQFAARRIAAHVRSG
jgi:hypothetical protein